MNDDHALSNPMRIYEELEQDILLLRIKPGELISENQLCERFEVSRTPIRGVLQRLAQADLVDIVPRKGTRVTRIDYRIVDQMIYQRKAVEGMVLRDYIRSSGPLDVEIVRKSLSDLSSTYEDGTRNGSFNPEPFRDEDLRMHEIWFEKMHKLLLWDNIRKTQSSYTRFCMLDMIETHNYEHVIREHGMLLQIIENRDETAIEPLLTQHLYGGVRRLGTKVFHDFRDFFIPESINI